jgi:uncharacterized protein (DUF302 family)
MNINELFFETESPFGFQETVDRITQSITVMGWKMPAMHDLQQTMLNFGKEVLPVKVFEICHPKHSSRILEKNDERIVSALMPCRISVYEKQNKKTFISRLNSGLMAASIGGIISEVMSDATHDVEQIIDLAIKN